MGTITKQGGTLQATLCEIERGVFYATYAGQQDVSHIDELTHYQTGTSASDAKGRLESHARSLGYETVVWTETVEVPLLASDAETQPHLPPAAQAERRA